MLRIRPRLERAMQLATILEPFQRSRCRALAWARAAFKPRLGLPFGFMGERINTKLYLIDSLRIHNQKARIRFPSFCGHCGSMHGRSIKTK